jgi:hypothetical protein
MLASLIPRILLMSSLPYVWILGKHVQKRIHNADRRRVLQSKIVSARISACLLACRMASQKQTPARANSSKQGYRQAVAAGVLNPPSMAGLIPAGLISTFQPAAISRAGLRKSLPVRANRVPDVATVASQVCIPCIPYEEFTGMLRLNTGSFGVVVRANWGPQDVVMKFFKGSSSDAAKNACREMTNDAVGRTCAYVIVPIGYTWGPKKREPVLIYAFGGSTLWEVPEVSISTSTSKLSICHKLCEGVAGLHQSGLIHADLKGNNVLFRQSTGKLRLIDLGVAMPITGDIKNPKFQMEGFVRRYWQAPEYSTCKTLTVAIDTYAIGFLLLDLLVPLQSGKTWRVQPQPGLVAASFDKNMEASVLSCFSIEPTSRPLLRALAQLFKKRKYEFPR